MSDKFVHLHNHTEYSFLDGFSRVWDTAAKEPGALIKRLKEIEQEYCAITDHGSTAGWVRFDKSCNKNDIKPIFGVEGYYCNDRHIKGLDEEQKLKAVRGIVGAKEKRAAVRKRENELGLSQRSHFVALAMNGEGLKEINKTLTIASTEGFYFRPRWDWELTSSMKNCIMTSGCAGGIINFHLKVDDLKNGNKERAWEEAKKWKKEFGDRFYIELMAIDWDKQGWIDKISYEIAKDLKIPMIITNDNHYVYPQDCETHDIMLALQSTHWKELETKDVLNDPNRMRYDMQDLYVKTRKEMFKSFRTHHKWIPKEEVSEMLSRTVEIAKRCHHTVNKKKMIMPKIKVPNVKGLSKKYDDWSDIERYFIFLIFKGWKDKIIPHIPKEKLNTYRKRLAYEIKHIKNLGFTPYFILTNRLMKWVDEQGILRGPARGSSAGSLIAYLLDITMIDPIPHKLLFSRFIDPNRTDFPDVDMDFEDTRRREVVQYFIDTYGADKVGILGNNMMFKPKAALKDVARLFKYEYHNMSISEIQEVCNLVVTRSGADSRLSFCLEDTFNQQEFAQKFRKNYPKVCHFAQELEGSVSRQGVHAAGVVISDVDINTYTALRRDKRQPDFLVTFMDKHDAEDIGILKMDVLGLNTMGIISETIKLIEKRYGKKINIEDLCRDVSYTGGDKKVYEAFAKARTEGVFQFMSPGLTRLAKQVHIDNFGEISDATALHRPGPIHSGAMNNYPAFKRGKTKETKKELHPIITKHTKDTYGLIIYQEQVMMIVRELGNFNWEQTNTVRKVMSKSGGAEYFMRTFWPTWKESCAEKGLDEKTALKAFHKIMSFGSWAFNKSHSVSYAMVSYICMWFKVNYPIEFVTAYLNRVTDSTGEKIPAMIMEAQKMGIEIQEPNVNYSSEKFVIHDDTIIAGLSDIKHVGKNAVLEIVNNQPYKGLYSFIRKTASRAVNKRTIENLIKAGAFDNFGYDKKKLLVNVEKINKLMKNKSEKKKIEAKELIKSCKGKEHFTEQEEAEMKNSVSPIMVGKHIVEYYNDITDKFAPHIKLTKLIDIELDEGKQQETDRKKIKRKEMFVIGQLTKVDLKRLSQEVKEVIDVKKEKRYALANFVDGTDFIVLSFKDYVYQRYEQKLFSWVNKVLLVQAECNVGWKKLYINKVWELEELRKYIGNNRKPYKFFNDYLFQHPLQRLFGKRLKEIREKFNAKPLIKIMLSNKNPSTWALGVISDIQERIIKKEKYKGQKMYIVYFEDETYKASFMIYPSDDRYPMMEHMALQMYKEKRPFLLYCQRDYKLKPEDSEFKHITLSIDKRMRWKDVYKTPFIFKGEKHG